MRFLKNLFTKKAANKVVSHSWATTGPDTFVFYDI